VPLTTEEDVVDVTKLLEADHRHVEDLFKQIDKAQGADRRPLIDDLTTSLRAHMALEEQVVYPAMRPVTGDEAVEEANVEHELGRKLLDDVIRLGPDEPGFGAALEALEAGISHHVEEEETEVFPELRSDGERVLAEIATPFMAKRLELGLPMEAEALAAASTKDELLDEARSAGIDGAASMTKAELAGALAAKMT
jgi:iron-sulfur cluster repair protein YtfE (RIC family)